MEKNFEKSVYGKSLKNIRTHNNLTQDEVSSLTGLDTKYISQIECGKAKGSIDTMLKFCIAYNVTPNDILYEFIESSKAYKELNQFTTDLSKLNNRDKTVILTLIKTFLENNK